MNGQTLVDKLLPVPTNILSVTNCDPFVHITSLKHAFCIPNCKIVKVGYMIQFKKFISTIRHECTIINTYIYIFIINYLCFIVLPAIMGSTQRLAHTQPWYPHVYKGRSLPGQNFLLVFTDSVSQLSNCCFWEKISFYNQNYNLFQSYAYWGKLRTFQNHSKGVQRSCQTNLKSIPRSSLIHSEASPN